MNQRQEARAVAEDVNAAAADWWVKQDRGVLAERESIAFEKWLADPQNARAYRRVSKASESLDGAETDPTFAALRQAALEIPRASRWTPRRVSVLVGTLAASCVAVAIGLVWFRGGSESTGTVINVSTSAYRTQVGEQQTVTLSDGSRVTLDTASEIDVALSPSMRLVNLHGGRARFEVAHDASRPFVVQAGAHRARALGTAFDVRLTGDDLDILLVEGSLLVEPLAADTGGDGSPSAGVGVKLSPGQRFTASTGRSPRVATAQLKREALWLDGFVEFDDQRLDAAVAELNRYAVTPILIRDPAVSAMRISGIFHTRQPQRFLEVVKGVLPVEVRREADESAEIVPKGSR